MKQQARPPQKDALRALTQRGHESVYQKGHTSESNDELAMAPPHMAGLNRKVRREKASMGSLKRASADVELLAPRSPMAKETMLTFSNTLPRASANVPEEPAQRHMTFHVRMDNISILLSQLYFYISSTMNISETLKIKPNLSSGTGSASTLMGFPILC